MDYECISCGERNQIFLDSCSTCNGATFRNCVPSDEQSKETVQQHALNQCLRYTSQFNPYTPV